MPATDRQADQQACVDASVVLGWYDVEDPYHAACVSIVTGEEWRLSTIDLVRLEVANVAVRSWRKPEAIGMLLEMVDRIGDDGGIVGMNTPLVTMAAHLAEVEGISVYDAAYVIGARKRGQVLVSCDERDLVSRGLAISPADALAGT
jgi:predicted nucleic acid-binding protein